MLGERLGADDIVGARPRQRGQERTGEQACEADSAECDALAAAPRDAGFHQRQQLIDGERQQRRGDAAEQHEHPVLRLQAGEDVIAEARLPDRRRQRRGADHPDRRGADAGHDHRQRERQFDHQQRLPRRHADATRGFGHRRIDALKAGDRVPQHRQHAVERERQHRGQEAERGEAEAEQSVR